MTDKKKSKKSFSSAELTTLNFGAAYRPKTVQDYVGQDHILKTFAGWQKTGKFPSTFMITGMTGSGKTTFARILAKTINCETLNACGKCRSCIMADGKHPDILEYNMGGDAGKVDGSQKIIDSASLSPMFRRRVFIMDESHLMSGAAESKFLKITEEPPAQTVWIWVTTNPEKMKDTMRNRSTKLNIQPIEPSVIASRLEAICEIEGIMPKKKDDAREALRQIAEYSSGQMRAGISILQAVYGAVTGGEPFTKDVVNEIAEADPEIDLEAKAAQMLAAYMALDLVSVIRYIREANNPRGLMSKARWILHGIIGHIAGTNKWQSAGLKMFMGIARKERFDINPVSALYLQKAMADIEMQFNSVNIAEAIIMESHITTLMCDIHGDKINTNLAHVEPTAADEDEAPKKKKKKPEGDKPKKKKKKEK